MHRKSQVVFVNPKLENFSKVVACIVRQNQPLVLALARVFSSKISDLKWGLKSEKVNGRLPSAGQGALVQSIDMCTAQGVYLHISSGLDPYISLFPVLVNYISVAWVTVSTDQSCFEARSISVTQQL